jgi:hypothetical protein
MVWKERNTGVFNNKLVPPSILLVPLKTELRLWVAAGGKAFGSCNFGRVIPFVALWTLDFETCHVMTLLLI